jgi:hypothetical protein
MNKKQIETLENNLNRIDSLSQDWSNLSLCGDEIYNNLSIAKEIDFSKLSASEIHDMTKLNKRISILVENIISCKEAMSKELTSFKRHKSAKKAYSNNR